MSEQDFLEMANQFKEVYEKMEGKLLQKDKIIKELNKKIMLNYTFSRLIDEIIQDMDLPIGCPLNTYSETLRGRNSEAIDDMLGYNDINIIDLHL